MDATGLSRADCGCRLVGWARNPNHRFKVELTTRLAGDYSCGLSGYLRVDLSAFSSSCLIARQTSNDIAAPRKLGHCPVPLHS